MTDDVRARIVEIDREVGALKRDVADMRTRQAVQQVETRATREVVDEMRADVKKLLWLIIGGFIAAAIAFIVRGGLSLPGGV